MAEKKRIDKVCDARLGKYFKITGEALEMAAAALDTSTSEREAQARDCLDMAQRYYADAEHFKQEGHYINAFGALNYAHGWLDAGARLRLFHVSDSRLFTVDGK